ncbi:MAG: 50S ribosomal protein L4 [Nanoarchaeota archaeon]
MKIKIFDTEGKKTKEMELPSFFSERIREDIVSKVLEASKTMHPYAPSLIAGKQHSASGIIRHARRKWRTAYGKGISRVPRKIMSGRGTQFNWVGAEIASTRGGRRAHPPKVISMINTKKINKREMNLALISAINATANEKTMVARYSRIVEKDMKELPLVVDSKFLSLKTKELVNSVKKILGEKISEIALGSKKIRSGKGKRRGRRYKNSAGMLLVVGKSEKAKAKIFEVKNTHNLNVNDLAQGGLGRLTVYTETAIKELGEKLK